MKQHYVYRVYNEAGRLLYVGVTDDVDDRLRQHRAAGAPWALEVAAVRAEAFPVRAEAEAAEAEAIATEWPLWNIRGSADPTARDMLRERRQARAAELQARPQPAVPPVPPVPASPAEDLRTALTLLSTAAALLADVAARLEAGEDQTAQAGA